MDAVRLGSSLRALRLRANLRQSDLAAQARVPREVISEVERGRTSRVGLDDLRHLATALGADLDVRIRWRGEQLDRLLDEAHAATVAATLARLGRMGWETIVEASFSIWGERGSIDILAWHEPSLTLLVIEVKSTIPDRAGDAPRSRPKGTAGAGDREPARVEVAGGGATACCGRVADLPGSGATIRRRPGRRASGTRSGRARLAARALRTHRGHVVLVECRPRAPNTADLAARTRPHRAPSCKAHGVGVGQRIGAGGMLESGQIPVACAPPAIDRSWRATANGERETAGADGHAASRALAAQCGGV